MFNRLHPSSTAEGSGIGLAICRRVIEHHGSEIWLTRREEEGLEVHFTLPAAVESQEG